MNGIMSFQYLLYCCAGSAQWSRELGCSSCLITLGQSIVMCVRPSEPALAGWAVQAAETSEAPEEWRRSKRSLCRDGEEKEVASFLFMIFAKWKGDSSSVALGASGPQLWPSSSSAGSSHWLAPPPVSGSSQVVSQNYSLCSCTCIYLILFIFCVQN